MTLIIIVPALHKEFVLDKSIRKLANHFKLEMPTRGRLPSPTTPAPVTQTSYLPHVWLRLSPTLLSDVWTLSGAAMSFVMHKVLPEPKSWRRRMGPVQGSGGPTAAGGSSVVRSLRYLHRHETRSKFSCRPGPKLEFVSRSYNFFLKRTTQVRFSDASAGSKCFALTLSENTFPVSRTLFTSGLFVASRILNSMAKSIQVIYTSLTMIPGFLALTAAAPGRDLSGSRAVLDSKFWSGLVSGRSRYISFTG